MLVATAGHVDHGKTSLIKHLTGTNTDHLAEEKRRGLTIELGYAFGQLQGEQAIGFIDVPGHQRFINTMISGISGIDLGMLVVAADDGPMPQTLEHLQLLRLLGVERFVGVITKRDLVDSARLQQVAKEAGALIPEAPLCMVSTRTGAGLDQLQALLHEQFRICPQRSRDGYFRLYIDRVFIKKGSGLVVTGTALSGVIRIGDQLQLQASAGRGTHTVKVRVRDIHAQGQPAETGSAGQRCALNLAGKISLQQVHRGDLLCAHPNALPERRLDTRCWTSAESVRTLKHLGRVKVYIGTRRIGARTYFLEPYSNKSASQRVQLILDSEVIAFAGDRFVLREDNELATLGGGIVIDPKAPQWGKSRSQRLEQLDALESGQPGAALEYMLFKNGAIASLRNWQRIWNLSRNEQRDILTRPPLDADTLVTIHSGDDELVLSRAYWERYLERFEQQLAAWHSARPMEPGVRPESLRILLRRQIPEQLFKALLDEHIRAGHIIHQEQLIRAAGHRPTLSPQVQRDWQQLVNRMTAYGLRLPLRSELQKDTGFDAKQLEKLTRPAIRTGELFEIGEKRLALPATLTELATRLAQSEEITGGISVIEAKQVFGLGRGLTIEILEFFDQIGYTRRRDNLREIADPLAAPSVESNRR